MPVDATAHLVCAGERYRRTDFIVLRGEESKSAVVAITRAESEPLFSLITSVEVLALPETCVYVERPAVDPANRSALSETAHELGIGPEVTPLVTGMYDHFTSTYPPRPR